MVKNKKAEVALRELLSRQDYLVVQGNDLAKSFGGLKSFEQKVLDYCFSYVTTHSKPDDEYEIATIDMIKHFGLATSGTNYKRINNALKRLNENTALYLPIERDGIPTIRMTQLFNYIDLTIEGRAYFRFSDIAAPYIFDLKEKFYSFKLRELSNINGKYALIMLKLWESKRRGKEKYTTLVGDLEQWQLWFLGKKKRVSAGRFFADVITRSIEELEEKFSVDFFVTTHKKGRKVVGYEITITDTSKEKIEGNK